MTDSAVVSSGEFASLFDELSNWGRWGPEDERGTLNLLTPERVAAAAALVREGRTVTMSLPLNTRRSQDNPMPADHHMTSLADAAPGSEPLQFIKDYVGADYHYDGHTHIDALCHVAYGGVLYGNRPESSVTADGAAVNTIEVLRDGLHRPRRPA